MKTACKIPKISFNINSYYPKGTTIIPTGRDMSKWDECFKNAIEFIFPDGEKLCLYPDEIEESPTAQPRGRGRRIKSMNQYFYWIDMDERGEFRAHVDDANDNVVFEIQGGEIFEDGFMSDKNDYDGLEDYLKHLGILGKDDYILNGNIPL